MEIKAAGWDDTVVALATPPGVGAIGVIRLSGKDAIGIADSLFPAKNLAEQPSHTLHVGWLKTEEQSVDRKEAKSINKKVRPFDKKMELADATEQSIDGKAEQIGENAQLIDEVVISLFRGPRSYTGEDVVEISCHGSPYILQQVINACTASGARLAKPGEFTLRAFLNGKLDLAQAEAVADLIASDTKAARDTALHAMRGGFSRVLSDLREQMIRFSALIELELDFSQEDVEFADRGEFYKLVNEAKSVTGRLLESFGYGNVIRNGVRVAIVGKPNAGKSTILNKLLNENRAIVSEIAGTTRDTVEEVLNIGGILFRLIDTAGLREGSSDVIELAGMERTMEKVREADVVVYVYDVSGDGVGDDYLDRTDSENEILRSFAGMRAKLLIVGNKIDLIEGDADASTHSFTKHTDSGTMDSLTPNGSRSVEHTDGGSTNSLPPNIHRSIEQAVGDTDPKVNIFESNLADAPRVLLSAKNDAHLDTLKQTLVDMVVGGAVNAGDTVITNARHYEALKNVATSIDEIIRGLDARLPGDLLALDIRRCLHYLGEITGEITNEDQLDYIFGKFCIGK